MVRTLLLAVLSLGPLAGGLAAEEEPVTFLPDLQFPTVDGGSAATWDFRGSKLLLVEFASW